MGYLPFLQENLNLPLYDFLEIPPTSPLPPLPK